MRDRTENDRKRFLPISFQSAFLLFDIHLANNYYSICDDDRIDRKWLSEERLKSLSVRSRSRNEYSVAMQFFNFHFIANLFLSHFIVLGRIQSIENQNDFMIIALLACTLCSICQSNIRAKRRQIHWQTD